MDKQNILIFLLLITILSSCAKSKDAEIESAIDSAKFYLTDKKCSKAKSSLEDIGQQKDNADYVATYASVIACTAGYSDLETAIENLDDIDATGTGGAGFLASFAMFPSSQIETTPDEVTYTKLLEAIKYILEADGGSQPSTVARIAKYGRHNANDLSMQALLMSTVAIGKFFALYANADSNGLKGSGTRLSSSNTCIYSYTMADAVSYINSGAVPGVAPCVAATGSEGSDFLESPSATVDEVKSRLCEGVILFNNMIDILSNISLSSNTSLGNVNTIGPAMTAVISLASIAETTGPFNTVVAYQNSIDFVKDITGTAACEAVPIERLEKWYSIFFETIY